MASSIGVNGMTKTSIFDAAVTKEGSEIKKWPGWPGDNVFRLVVPVDKVGSIIGKKGEIIKKICEETRAKVRIIDGVAGTTDRVVLIFGKEELEAEISPAMNAVLRVFNRVFEIGADVTAQQSSSPAPIRLLVPSTQAIFLIGKQGATIKSIQEITGATIRVLTGDDLPYVTAEERIVDIQGEYSKVSKALEAVVGHLRKFLVDHSVVPLFEQSPNAPQAPLPSAQVQEHLPLQNVLSDKSPWSSDRFNGNEDKAPWELYDKAQSLIQTAQHSASDYPFSLRRESLYLDHETQSDVQAQRLGLSSLYRSETPLSGLRSSTAGLGRNVTSLITQMTQTMQIPLSYAEDIIGVGGANIAYIRRTSGAILTVQESGSSRDEITVDIKGTSAQVQTAQQLIQEFIEGHKEQETMSSSYGGMDSTTGLRSSYANLSPPNSSYPSSSLAQQTFGSGYGSSTLGASAAYSGRYRM